MDIHERNKRIREKVLANRWYNSLLEFGMLARFFAQLALAAGWVWEHIVYPALRVFSKPFRVLFHWYRAVWERWVYTTDKFGNRRFSVFRGGVTLASTIAMFWIIPVFAWFFIDVALYAFTAKQETVFLSNSQEVISEGDVHAISGCHDLPCTDDNSIYFRVTPDLFHQVWSLVHGHGFFFPDYVAAAVPVGVSRCKAVTYGIRAKLFMRGTDIYPYLLSAQCEPCVVENCNASPKKATGTSQPLEQSRPLESGEVAPD